MQNELAAVQAIETTNDHAVFKRLCEIFAVEVDDSVIALMLNYLTPEFGLHLAKAATQIKPDGKIIKFTELLPVKLGETKLFMNRFLDLDSLHLKGAELILQSKNGALMFKSCRIVKMIGDRYANLGDGTVLDIHTNLQWMRCALGQNWTGNTCSGAAKGYKWDEAHNAVAELNNNGGYAGYSDWRLPSIHELKTLVYCSSGQPKTWNDTGTSCEGNYSKPTIDLIAFPNTPNTRFWSSSPDTFLFISTAWGVYFDSGYAGHNFRNDNLHVRLVRSGQ
ncbi:DUF1566 domain-containing protein [Chromatium okenii]|uniref:Lcl C-terminal domain-containing protein n=1 Tax=Chromatium okenii TaxID=61644 RepID=UPI001F5B16B1|nr:DUF1566 domain-containing protein [Chromatium okenii]